MSFSCTILIVLCLNLLSTTVRSEEKPKSDFEIMMENQAKKKTREQDVTFEGVKYRKIEYKNHIYYLAFAQPDASSTDLKLICEREGQLPFVTPPRVEGQIQLTERTSVFISVLEDACSSNRDQVVIPAVKLGFKLPEEKNDSVKDKKVYMNLLNRQLGFSGNF